MTERSEESCDVKIWCEECKRSEYTTSGGKYLCVSCGKLLHLSHEVHHEGFPHVTGDEDKLY